MERYTLNNMISDFECHVKRHIEELEQMNDEQKATIREFNPTGFDISVALYSICLELKETRSLIESHMDEFFGGH